MDLEDLKTKQDAVNLLKKEEIEDFVLVVRCKNGNKRALYAGYDQKILLDWIYDDAEFNDTVKVHRSPVGHESDNASMKTIRVA